MPTERHLYGIEEKRKGIPTLPQRHHFSLDLVWRDRLTLDESF
jgi:hypothetical protein